MKAQALTFAALAARARGQRFDFVKLDLEGDEAAWLGDPAHRAALCDARCIVLDVHEHRHAGAQAAVTDFLTAGCPGGDAFARVDSASVLQAYCRATLMLCALCHAA